VDRASRGVEKTPVLRDMFIMVVNNNNNNNNNNLFICSTLPHLVFILNCHYFKFAAHYTVDLGANFEF